MRYRVTMQRGNVKEVIWDIPDTHELGRYPTFLEIEQAREKEFHNCTAENLEIVPVGGGEIILRKKL